MKKLLLGLLLVILPVLTFAQNPVEKVFDKYSGKDGVTTITVNKQLFKMMSQFETKEQELKVLENLEFIKILAIEDSILNREFYDQVNSKLEQLDYEELMNIKGNTENVKFLVKQQEDVIKELVMLAGEKSESALIYIKGNIKLEDISKIVEVTNPEKK